jgi:hypothetical protein
MNTNEQINVAEKLGLTKNNKPNLDGCSVLETVGDWKHIVRPYKDPVHGWCTASVWVKEDFMIGLSLERK